MKVQINSLAALERLLGGDTTVEIELRGAIVQEFAKKHLKAVAKSAEVTKAIEATQVEILSMAQKQLSEKLVTFTQHWGGTLQNVKLHPEIVAEIKRLVGASIDRKVSDTVTAVVEARMAEEPIDKLIEARVQRYITDTVNSQVNARLKALAAQL